MRVNECASMNLLRGSKPIRATGSVRFVSLAMREPLTRERLIRCRTLLTWRASLICGCTLTVRTARRVCWTNAKPNCLPGSNARIPFRSIRTNGCSFRLMQAVCCFAIRLRRRRRSALMKPTTSRCMVCLRTPRLRIGVTAWSIAEAISEDNSLAMYLGELVSNADDFELLAPVELSICCFRYAPKNAATSELDQLNAKIMAAVQKGGRAYLSNATVNGKFALRACITNFRTTKADVEETLRVVREAARSLATA